MRILSILLFFCMSIFVFSKPSFAQGSTTKRIEVNLSNQTLQAFQGQTLIYNFPISSGLPAHPTVTGTFHPYAKLLSTTMIGGSKAAGDYYNLPNVPYTMYFYQGYAIHGTYWHNNFGHPMSHGCINLPTDDARQLYYWTDYSTPITIYGIAPAS